MPIDDELATMIEAQQARTRQRFPTTTVLLPRASANRDRRLSIPTATFVRQPGQWLQTWVGLHEHLDWGLTTGPSLHVVGVEVLQREVQHT